MEYHGKCLPYNIPFGVLYDMHDKSQEDKFEFQPVIIVVKFSSKMTEEIMIPNSPSINEEISH